MLCLLTLALPAAAAGPVTSRQIVERIQKNLGVPWSAETVDTFKAGDPDAPVSGIATTFIATFDVLKRAVAGGKNLIITHEPTFWEHRDRTDALAGDPVLAAKQKYIADHGLIIFRFHDHWHMRRPDGIFEGFLRDAGWKQFETKPGLYTVPRTTLKALAAELQKKFRTRSVRVIGDPALQATRVAFVPGAAPLPMQMAAIRDDANEVVILGEASEWQVGEFVRDAGLMGRKKAAILLGHVQSEEPGMQECARWLKTFVSEVPIEFVPAGEPFWLPGQQ